MEMNYTFTHSTLFAQAYGAESYGQQEYSYCEQTPEGCVPVATTTSTSQPAAPNTGFFGLSQDAAIGSISGALLVAVAVAGAVYVVVSRRRAAKKNTPEQ